MNYRHFIKSILDISFVGMILTFRREYFKWKIVKSFDYNYVSNFWNKELTSVSNGKAKKIYLVDGLLSHFSYSEKNFFIANVLRTKFGGRAYVLLPFSISLSIKHLSKVFGLNHFISLYTLFNIPVIYNALIQTLKQLPKLKYDLHKGISIVVDNNEVGDLIYDEYLRKTDLHTQRNISIFFILFVFRSLYLYYRYRQIILRYGVTDIIIGHNVYANWGLLVAAANSIDKSIMIWNWLDSIGNRINVCHYSAQIPIPKPKYFEEKYFIFMRNYFREKNLIFKDEVEDLKGKIFSGTMTQNYDSINVYQKNTINDIVSFRHEYMHDEKKKTISIYSHAFVDAVKYARWSLYSDYFTWLEQTLLFMAKNKIDANVYVKPHPSESAYPCNMTTETLVACINKETLSNFIFLGKQVSNNLLFDISDLIITSNGTVASEASLFGKHVLVAGESNCENARAILRPNSLREYYSIISNVNYLKELDPVNIERAHYAFYWSNKLAYLSLPICIDVIHKPMNKEDEIVPYIKLLNDTYKNNQYMRLPETKFYNNFVKSIDYKFQDTFDF